MTTAHPDLPLAGIEFHPADELVVPRLVAEVRSVVPHEAMVNMLAHDLVDRVRQASGGIGGLEDFLRAYDLGTQEGLALMVMAESVLRVPDSATQEALIEEKITAGDWNSGASTTDRTPLFVVAATLGLDLSTRVVGNGGSSSGVIRSMVQRIGRPTVRTGVRQAMRYLGHHFVLGETIGAALSRASKVDSSHHRFSYDMLGEGARTLDDAERYRQSYADAIDAIGRDATTGSVLPQRPGISVKLSALHPSYDARHRRIVMKDLVPIVTELARSARSHSLNFTIDAEEADRLELSLEVIDAALEALASDGTLIGWSGFGLAVQAYQKRAPAVIDWLERTAKRHNTTIMVRLVKGAYWDTEIKHAQVEGHEDFPVFTRKAATDVCYVACSARLLAARPHLYPQFATHNALTVATILSIVHTANERNHGGFEFQRLHGMGEALYDELATRGLALPGETERRHFAVRVYAPVGGHRDLLAYLVRRLLENGANSSFVARMGDPNIPIESLLTRPVDTLGQALRHPDIARAPALFAPRDNSAGLVYGWRTVLDATARDLRAARAETWIATPLVDGARIKRTERDLVSPIDGTVVGRVTESDTNTVEQAFTVASKAWASWNALGAEARARMLEQAANALERRRPEFLGLLAREAGKTIDDGIAEVREAVDFLRYYASEARRLFVQTELPGPVGEHNSHVLGGRGVVVTIAPWNFPLAIFLGQTAAALAAGNACLAKPAPQTPLIADAAVRLLHQAGIPSAILALIPGGPDVGRALVEHPATSAVAFTGSGPTARAIARSLAMKDGPIVPLIAETGGVNAMIVDATALPEQVTDDVVMSAFRSAGQRCSALRVLYLQDDIAERMLTMIEGAAATLVIGDALDIATDVGPIIDADACKRLQDYVDKHATRVRWRGDTSNTPASGHWFAPHVLDWPSDEPVAEEVFGPVLHIKRWSAGTLDTVLDDIVATGFGLTFGVHSRIDAVVEHCVARAPAGNMYVNRNTIGAIVGSQPFGGSGLSGTGPKAGGPLYLTRFAEEHVVSTDTTAAGGNASLLARAEEQGS